MRFDFSSTEIELTINGVDCTLDVGDAEMQYRLIEAAELIQRSELAGNGANVQASEQLRQIVEAILGEETTGKIYKGTRPNVYKDVELILFLRRALDEAEPTQKFNTTMGALGSLIGLDD